MTNSIDTQRAPDLPYAVEITPEEQDDGAIVFIATHPELPGCMAHGATVEEAIEDLRAATELYISGLTSRGIEIPAPNIRRTG